MIIKVFDFIYSRAPEILRNNSVVLKYLAEQFKFIAYGIAGVNLITLYNSRSFLGIILTCLGWCLFQTFAILILSKVKE